MDSVAKEIELQRIEFIKIKGYDPDIIYVSTHFFVLAMLEYGSVIFGMEIKKHSQLEITQVILGRKSDLEIKQKQ